MIAGLQSCDCAGPTIRVGTEEQLGIYRLDRFERGGLEPEGVWGGSGIAAGTASPPKVEE